MADNLAGPDAIVPASEASAKGESVSEKVGKAISARTNSSGGGRWSVSFPQNSAGHPAWIRMQIVERVAAGLSEMMSATSRTPAGQLMGTINLYMPQTITFSDGSTITANILFAGGDIGAPGLVEAGVSKVVVADTSNAEVYVLMRNFQIR